MTIETNFEINDLVKHKFTKNPNNQISLLEIMNIETQTCNAKTQVFYLCRPISAQRSYSKKEKPVKYEVYHGISNAIGQPNWQKYREDELTAAGFKETFVIRNGIEYSEKGENGETE